MSQPFLILVHSRAKQRVLCPLFWWYGFDLSGDYGKVSCPSSESNSGLDADDTETSPDAEGSGYFVSREPGSFGSGKAASRSCLGCFASLLVSLLCSKLTSYLEKEKKPRPILTFERIENPCLTGPPWICFTKYCLCLLSCIWEIKVQCFLSLSISPKASVSVDSTVETVGGAASLWFGFWCLRSRLTLLGGLELSWKTQKLWLELRYGSLCSGICLPSCFCLLAIDPIHTLLERGGILLPLATLPCARHCVRAFDAPHQLFLSHPPKLPVNLPFRSYHRTDLLRSSKPFPIRQNGSFQSRLSRWEVSGFHPISCGLDDG